MNYHLKTDSGRKYTLSAAEYSLLREYGTIKNSPETRFLKTSSILLLCIMCLLTTNLSAIGNAEILEKNIHIVEQNLTKQLIERIHQTNKLWIQIELSAD